jgi:hypothetical protein
MRRIAGHGDGIALVFARTETSWFFESVWSHAHALLFLRGRIAFIRPCGLVANHNAGGPSVLVAYGKANATSLRRSRIRGVFVDLNRQAKA